MSEIHTFPDPKVIEEMSQLLNMTLESLYEIAGFNDDHDNPKVILGAIKIFAIFFIFHLSKKIETLRPGYGDFLLSVINEVTKKDSEVMKIMEKPAQEGYLEKSESGIPPDELVPAVDFLGSRIIDQLEKDFGKLPLLLQSETTLLWTLGSIATQVFKKFDHKDLDAFTNKFSEIIRFFASIPQDINKLEQEKKE